MCCKMLLMATELARLFPREHRYVSGHRLIEDSPPRHEFMLSFVSIIVTPHRFEGSNLGTFAGVEEDHVNF